MQEQLDALGRGDHDAALQHADPDIELETFAPPVFPFVRHARGVPQPRSALEHKFGAVLDQRPTRRGNESGGPMS